MNITKRVGLALTVLQKVREEIESNGNIYSGALKPNLTSVSDVLTLPDGMLDEQIAANPEIAKLVPTPDQLLELERMWLASPG